MFNFFKRIFIKKEQYQKIENSGLDDALVEINNFVSQSVFGKCREINEIIIHCTGTKTTDEIFINKNNAYHFVIDTHGNVLLGRPISMPPENSFGHKAKSLAIAYIGGLDFYNKPADTRTQEQKDVMNILVKKITEALPIKHIYGHNNIRTKNSLDKCILECPCFDVEKEF